jgi:hypothetical protein
MSRLSDQRIAFVDRVLELVDTRVAHRGRSRHAVDCVGLVIVALSELGIDVDEQATTYGKIPDADLLSGCLARYAFPVGYDDRMPGDLLQLWHGERARHLAVLTSRRGESNVVVVADPAAKRVLLTQRSRERVACVWRLRWQA